MSFAKVDPSTGFDVVATALREFVLKQFPLARKNQVKNSDALLESGMVDSMGILDVVAFIEKEYSIVISDEELIPENFQSIDCIATFVVNKLPAKA